MAQILIIDDDPDIVEAARLFLEREGYEVISASNPSDGAELVAKGTADLLILDIMMEQPDDGIALAQQLRREGFAKPILMMSSISRVMGQEYGPDDAVAPVDDFLEKPVKPEVLIEKVRELLSRS